MIRPVSLIAVAAALSTPAFGQDAPVTADTPPPAAATTATTGADSSARQVFTAADFALGAPKAKAFFA